jgi:hypothetical protein
MNPPIAWQGRWGAFNLAHKESYFLGELRWEIETNIEHPLHGKEAKIAGWIEGYDDFILYLPQDHRYAYVHLTWHRETRAAFPHCEFLSDVNSVNGFLAQWQEDERKE